MGSVPAKVSIYDRIKEQLDTADLIRRLGLKLVRTSGSEAYCEPLCHESSGGESLQINLHTGAWNCKACQESGVFGDLIQLVEYTINGGMVPTHGRDQSGSSTHRGAVEWLCDQFGIPFRLGEVYTDPALSVIHMVAAHAHRYLLSRPDVMELVQELWGFDRSTIESHVLGFIPSPITPELAREAAQPESKAAFRSSGIGWYSNNEFRTRFEGRLIFPYLESGQAVYLIGRATKFTPKLDGGSAPPKYHKLSVHSEDRKWISERVTNDHLYNEPILKNADKVVVAEGVADAVALSSIGVPVVSPVTISFNSVDIERFVRKASEGRVTRVEILFDNELSGNGTWGARRAGKKLAEFGLAVSILTLPLGDVQLSARQEVLDAFGEEVFADFESASPKQRKEMLIEHFPDEAKRGWVIDSVNASKIDAAEWVKAEGAAAPSAFSLIQKGGRDIIEVETNCIDVDPQDNPVDRLALFIEVIELAAHVDEALLRGEYAGLIATRAGKGVTKASVAQKISRARKVVVRPKREGQKEREQAEERASIPDMIIPPPSTGHVQPAAPIAPPTTGATANPGAPAAPPPPMEKEPTDHERFETLRQAIARNVEKKTPEELVGMTIADALTRSMGYTPFLTPSELYLVRGNERVPVGIYRKSHEFSSLIYMVAGLTTAKPAHRSYIDVATYHLKLAARKAEDVAWSYVDEDGSVYFPTGDLFGNLLHIEPGKVQARRMAESKVPAVAGSHFHPFEYKDEGDGVSKAIDVFRWTSLSSGDRLVLIYWIVCLPLLRRIGTIPIVRIEGGSSSGKTRAVDAVSMLVNGGKASTVPTSAALISRLSMEMLTIDDNRESDGVSSEFLGTLLQATNLGAREKRRNNSDTGTVIERVSGAILMNGVEPIHNGRSELASRMLTMRCEMGNRSPDSPTAYHALNEKILGVRDEFLSESARRCAAALLLDETHGERIGEQIEEIFGETRIGRLASYLRMMYFAYVAGLPEAHRAGALDSVQQVWRDAFNNLGRYAMDSLIREELSVSAVRYAMDYAAGLSTHVYPNSEEKRALEGKYQADLQNGDETLGWLTAPQLARLARTAGKEMNAPRAITSDLRAGQLEARILDGVGFLQAAGITVEYKKTNTGKHRFAFYRRRDEADPETAPAETAPVGPDNASHAAGDTWRDPDDFQ